MPQMLPPLTEETAGTCTAWPRPDAISCIFFYFLIEWTWHTLTQDLVLGGRAVRTG